MSKQRSHGSGTLFKRNGHGVWIARWYNHAGRRQEASTRTSDRRCAEQILAKHVSHTALRKAGVVDARTDHYAEAHRHPLSEHLVDWLAGLQAKGVTPKQVSLLGTRARTLLAATHAEWIVNLSASTVQTAIGDLHSAGQSLQTCQHYLRAVKQFTRWLTRDGRAQRDVLAHLTGYNVQAEPRYERRPLDADELVALIHAAEAGPVWRGMSGPDRAVAYKLAVGTGFRVSELGSLIPESFHLDDTPPAVTLRAAYSKRRREDRQPIHPSLATCLRDWLADKPKGEPVFQLPEKTAAMVRMDLQAARKQWLAASSNEQEQKARQESAFLAAEDDAGRVVDFHALRVSFITALVKGGTPVKVAQELARHSTPTLTLNVYSKLGIHDLVGALDVLPDLASDSILSSPPVTPPVEARNGASRCKPKQQQRRKGAG